MSKHSCETQLVDFIHQLHNFLEKGEQVDAVMMDFRKDFDNRLLLKLEHSGIQGSSNRWIGSFLSGRSQKVVVDGEHSSSAPVTSGVPQGSVTGPALFLVYMYHPKSACLQTTPSSTEKYTTQVTKRCYRMTCDHSKPGSLNGWWSSIQGNVMSSTSPDHNPKHPWATTSMATT